MGNKIRGPHDFIVGDYALCVDEAHACSRGDVVKVNKVSDGGHYIVAAEASAPARNFLRVLTDDDGRMPKGTTTLQVLPGQRDHMKKRTWVSPVALYGFALKSLPQTDNDLLRTRIREARETIELAERLIGEAGGILDE